MSVINAVTKQIVYTFQGSVYVQLGASPTGYEELYLGDYCNSTFCGQKVVGSLASVPFMNGIATFSVSEKCS